jgi:putative transposase
MAQRDMSGGSRCTNIAPICPQPMTSALGVRIIAVMYRPRIEVPGGFYHVGTRGNNRQPIYVDDDDRRRFLLLLERSARRYDWTIYTYCLMTNHYHVVLQLSDRGLSQGMCELNGGYALGFNDRHGRSNHLFGKRFWDRHIDNDAYLLEVCRYVVLNPLRAGREHQLGTWPWSSYRAAIGVDFAPSFLAVGDLLRHFGSTPATAKDAFIRHVSEGPVQRQPLDEPPPT